MSFDQRPARATKRVITPAATPTVKGSTPATPQQIAAAKKSGARASILFIMASIIGGLGTTAAFYGMIPGVSPVTLPTIFP